MNALAMFVLFLVGFLVGACAVALIAKFIGNALKPTLPSLEAPVRKVVIRRRTIQVGEHQTGTAQPHSQEKPRPKVEASRVAGSLLTT